MILKRFFSLTVDFNNPNAKAKWLFDLKSTIDDIVNVLNTVTSVPSGSGGNVVGPGSAVNGDIVLFDGTTGRLIKDSNRSVASFDQSGAAATVQTNLNTHTALTTTAHGGIIANTDPRLSDARTPLAHTHTESDVINLTSDLLPDAPSDGGKYVRQDAAWVRQKSLLVFKRGKTAFLSKIRSKPAFLQKGGIF